MIMEQVSPNPRGDRPEIDGSAWLDPSARVVGRVSIGPRVFVGPVAVLRADEPGPDGTVAGISIGPESNVQDGVIIHALGGTRVDVGRRVSLAHGCVVHGPCSMGDGCFVGFRAIVYHADVGAGTMIAAAALVQDVTVPPGRFVPPGTVVISQEQADALPPVGPRQQEFMARVVAANLALANGYRRPG